MIEDHDFSLPADDANASPVPAAATPGPQPAEAPAPVIVVEQHPRGVLSRLMPPLLILMAALAITSYRGQEPIRLMYRRTPAVATVPSHTAPPAVAPTTLPSGPLPPTAAAPVPDPVALPPEEDTPVAVAPTTPRPSPFDLDPSDGLHPLDPAPPLIVGTGRPDPPPPGVVVLPLPGEGPIVPAQPAEAAPGVQAAVPAAPDVDREAILDDIQREAALKARQQKEMEELKPRARAQLLQEALVRIEAQRTTFRNELREALKTFGHNAAPEIERIVNAASHEMPTEVERAYHRARRAMPRGGGLQQQVDSMRSFGIPEPSIFEFLAHKLHTTINTRGGPRDPGEVRVRTAQLLLTMVPAKSRSAAADPTSRPLASAMPEAAPATEAPAAADRRPDQPPSTLDRNSSR